MRLNHGQALRIGVVALAVLSLGAQCNPEPRACGVNDGVHSCGLSSGATPPSSVVPACINFCAPVPTGSPAGEVCAVDPCDESVWSMSGVFLCPSGWSCDPDTASPLSTLGRCVQNGQHYLAECDPAERFETPCELNTFCRPIADCPSLPSGVNTAGRDGVCYMYQREGQACEGNWDDPAAKCLPCAAGLDCVGGLCRRPCADVEECPCDTETVEFACEEGYCNFCYPNLVECDPDLVEVGDAACCDALSTCDYHSNDGRSEAVCCREVDAECNAEGQCCGGLACDPTTDKCAACLNLGETWYEEHPLGCCDGFEPREPEGGGEAQCLPECDEGTECGRCDHNDNLFTDDVFTTTCTDGGPECTVPGAAPMSDSTLDDDCDGYDDDCDGRFDEGFAEGSACTSALSNGFCSGMTFQGVRHCGSDEPGFSPSGGPTNEGWVCQHTPGVHYCASNYTGHPPVLESAYLSAAPPACGAGPGAQPCTDHSHCRPDHFCGYHESFMDPICLPKHPDTATGYSTDCGEMCWLPGTSSSGVACP